MARAIFKALGDAGTRQWRKEILRELRNPNLPDDHRQRLRRELATTPHQSDHSQGPAYLSALLHASTSTDLPSSATADDWVQHLRTSGVSEDEIRFSGLKNVLRRLSGNDTPIPRAKMQQVIAHLYPTLAEKVLTGAHPLPEAGKSDGKPYFAPGQEWMGQKSHRFNTSGPHDGYGEMLVTVPRLPGDDGEEWGSMGHFTNPAKFGIDHDNPNILFHLRMTTRRDIEGRKVLHLEEVQSDANRRGMESGFKTPQQSQDRRLQATANPMDPAWGEWYRQPPEGLAHSQWMTMAAQRALRWAAENGYDGVTWNTGKQQENRYVHYYQTDNALKNISWMGDGQGNHLFGMNGRPIVPVPDHLMDDMFGRRLSNRVREASARGEREGTFDQLDLRDLGEGVAPIYDEHLPRAFEAALAAHAPRGVEYNGPHHSPESLKALHQSVRGRLNPDHGWVTGADLQALGDVGEDYGNRVRRAALSGSWGESMRPHLEAAAEELRGHLTDKVKDLASTPQAASELMGKIAAEHYGVSHLTQEDVDSLRRGLRAYGKRRQVGEAQSGKVQDAVSPEEQHSLLKESMRAHGTPRVGHLISGAGGPPPISEGYVGKTKIVAHGDGDPVRSGHDDRPWSADVDAAETRPGYQYQGQEFSLPQLDEARHRIWDHPYVLPEDETALSHVILSMQKHSLPFGEAMTRYGTDRLAHALHGHPVGPPEEKHATVWGVAISPELRGALMQPQVMKSLAARGVLLLVGSGEEPTLCTWRERLAGPLRR